MALPLFAYLCRRNGRSTAAGRREFLRMSLACGAASLISNRSRAPAAAPKLQQRVVVVGAGLAGLACGHELRAAGYDVLVVDGRRRIGGRVLSFHDFVPGKHVEAGGEFIGSNHPTWAAYADQFGLEFLDVSEDEDLDMPVHICGKMWSPAEVARLYEEMDTATAAMTELAASINADEPWASPDAELLDNRTIAAWIAELSISDEAKSLVAVQISSDNAIANDKASLLGMLAAVQGGGGERYWTDTETYRCVGGNQVLAQRLLDGIGVDNVLLGDPVASVDRLGAGVRVSLKGGRVIECDEVVLATPPSTWRHIRFEPGMPERLKPQMGIACKHMIALPSRFWKDAGLSQYGLSDGPVAQTWELTDAQTTGDPDAALVAFSGGPSAAMCLDFAKEERDDKYATEIDRLFPGAKEKTRGRRTLDWPNDPATLAGYSFPAPGEVTTVAKDLHAGLEKIHFCGEHACPKFVGYMEGALNSGVSVAKRLAGRG